MSTRPTRGPAGHRWGGCCDVSRPTHFDPRHRGDDEEGVPAVVQPKSSRVGVPGHKYGDSAHPSDDLQGPGDRGSDGCTARESYDRTGLRRQAGIPRQAGNQQCKGDPPMNLLELQNPRHAANQRRADRERRTGSLSGNGCKNRDRRLKPRRALRKKRGRRGDRPEREECGWQRRPANESRHSEDAHWYGKPGNRRDRGSNP